MVLTTHIVVGAAGARLFASHPIQAFFIGWMSHYILDAIVHWDYPMSSIQEPEERLALGASARFGKAMMFDMAKVAIDVVAGFLLLYFFIRDPNQFFTPSLIAGAIGGVLPDFLQFFYLIWKNKFLEILQRFHHFMHAHGSLNGKHFVGSMIQILIVVGIVFLLHF